MKKLIIFSLLASVYLFTLTSCIKDVDNIDLPSEEPKLTIASFFSPQDTVHAVHLTWSKPIFGGNNNNFGTNFIEDAQVVVSDGNQDYTFIWNTNQQAYIYDNADLKYQTGQEYTLTVSKDDKVATATSAAPSAPSYAIQHLNSVVTSNDSWSKEYTHNFLYTIKDNGDMNYYRVSIGLKKDYGNGAYTEMHSEQYIKGSYGQETKISADFYADQMSTEVSDTLSINVMRCTEAYYLYHQSIMNYSGDNPFGEPTITYSNVDNGLGVFCGYQIKQEELILPIP